MYFYFSILFTTLHTAGASEILISQSGISKWGKLYCPDITFFVHKKDSHVRPLIPLNNALNIHEKRFEMSEIITDLNK